MGDSSPVIGTQHAGLTLWLTSCCLGDLPLALSVVVGCSGGQSQHTKGPRRACHPEHFQFALRLWFILFLFVFLLQNSPTEMRPSLSLRAEVALFLPFKALGDVRLSTNTAFLPWEGEAAFSAWGVPVTSVGVFYAFRSQLELQFLI